LHPQDRSLLLIGHPGHELRVYGWLARARPLVCVLTDGSGSDGAPRIEATLAILRDLDAAVGPLCAEFSDRQIYAHLLAHEYAVFVGLRDRLADLLVREHIDDVVSDGVEGYNPTHDVCHALAAAAVACARRRGAATRHRCIPLMGDPRTFAGRPAAPGECVELAAGVYAEKMRRIREYAALSGATLQREVDETLQQFGEDVFATEYLFEGSEPSWQFWSTQFAVQPPYYETYGRQQVAAGRYSFLISFAEHVRPAVDALFVAHADTVAGAHA